MVCFSPSEKLNCYFYSLSVSVDEPGFPRIPEENHLMNDSGRRRLDGPHVGISPHSMSHSVFCSLLWRLVPGVGVGYLYTEVSHFFKGC